MRICVIGAGVVGVTTAWLLARRGWQVTLLDACAEPAQATSYANGGQLSYSYVAPLAGPGVLGNVPKWLLCGDSPLRFRLRLDPHQWRWCLSFIKACNASASESSTAQLLELSYLSRRVLNTLIAETPIEFGHSRNGKLIVYRSPALLEKARSLVEYQSSLGAQQQILTTDQCVQLEPALAQARGKLAGAVYTPSEESGDCHQFTLGLFRHLSALPNVKVLMGMNISRLERSGHGISAAVSTGGASVSADHFIVAAGMGSFPLLDALGARPMLYPLKGYSLSVPGSPGQTPAISVTDYERRTVYANLNGTLRIAAMVGIGATGNGIDDDRISLIKRQTTELFPAIHLDHAKAWAGSRPATPHGRPIIGRSPAARNLWLNIGHGALGFTLACGSSHLLETMLAAEPSPIDPSGFLPS